MNRGSGTFDFGRVRVWYHCPQGRMVDLPVVFALHVRRAMPAPTAIRGRAMQMCMGFLLLAPAVLFGALSQMNGRLISAMCLPKAGRENPEADWSFQVIEGIF